MDLWHAPLADVYKHLQCDDCGLTNDEALARLQRFGGNGLLNVPPRPYITAQFFGFLWNPVSWIMELCCLGLLALSSRNHRAPDWWTPLGIVGLLCVNSVIGVRKERRAFDAVSGLMQSNLTASNATAKVKRASVWSEIDASELVPGDIVELRQEDTTPADCRLLSGDALYVRDGESSSRRKGGDVCFFGTRVILGKGEAIVVATGGSNSPVRTSHSQPAYSATSLHGIVAQIFIFNLALIAISFLIEASVLFGPFDYNFHRGIDALFILLIGGIPVTLPTAISVACSAGVNQLTNHGVLVKRAAAVEELSRVTLLLLENSAVLTEEKLVIDGVKVYGPFSADQVVSMVNYARSIKTPNDNFYLWSYFDGSPTTAYPEIEIVHYKYCFLNGPIQVTYRANGSQKLERVWLGMAGSVADMCTHSLMTAIEDQLEADAEAAAVRGMRILAVAYQELDGDDPEADEDSDNRGMIGLLQFFKPLQQNTEHGVAQVFAMGVETKMVTAEQLVIAKETGRRAGLGDNIVLGRKLHEDRDRFLDSLILDAAGFAGCDRESKQKLVQRLQYLGHACAMIGTGIEDRASISAANVSIAVKPSRPVAWLTTDLLMTRPGLPIVVEALRDSRQVFRRLHGSFIYACALTIRTVLCFPLLALIYKLDFPPFMIFILAVTSDIATLTLSMDRVEPGTKPGYWDLTEIFSYSAAYGSYLALSTILFVFATERSFFQRRFGLSLDPSQHENQLRALVYLQVALLSHALIFVVRSEQFFSRHRPSIALLGAFCLVQIGSSLIAAYGHWEFANIYPVDAGWVGIIWIWNVVWFVPLEFIKAGVRFALKSRHLERIK
ncbi:hypothetical protein DFH07DRAFT_815081 [Mycena maculata]|uniref:Cation-transporting P-type ATPase N-terminal domain-containing protein n=1 Tax=Mycena maculata TaxID=230809 RepID=A0AAD7NI44_9AGAR|nr:hypothetical protein DFH07DRAFT_815081 [Mycena maculata]